MEKKEVNRLIKGLLTDQLSWEEKEKLSQHKSVEERMKRQWRHAAESPEDREMGERVWKRLEECRKPAKPPRYQLSFQRFVAAASIILFVIAGSLWLLKQNWESTTEYIVFTADKALMYMLPDSSKVWMKTGSNIRYAQNFGSQREVWLEGEALFDVTKGKKQHFIVHIPKAFIEVKGTSFQIKKNKYNKNEITLFEGEVEFNIQSTNQCIAMNPLDKIIYDPETADITMEKVEHMNWENGRYLFTDITLAQLIEIINDRYDSQIILGKNVNKKYKYSGSLYHDEPLENVIKKLCYSMSLKVEKKGEEILIY